MSSVNDAGVARTYGYDARGNVTSNGKHSFYYDLSDQPTGVSGVGSYVYDGNLKRVKSIQGSKTTYSVYGLGGQLLYTDKVTDNKKTDYIRAAGQTIARIENNTVTYPHNDLLGSPVSATTSTGVLDWQEQYTPYGEKRLNPAKNKDNVGYTGHVQDDITGLTYMQARYYDPAIGRFLSIDPVGFSAEKPMMFNRYAYANNNPYLYTDPTGRNPAIDRRLENLSSLSTSDAKAIGNFAADFTPIVGDVKGFVEAYQNPSLVTVSAAIIGLVPGAGDAAGKFIKGADSAVNNASKVKLNKQLASESQMGEISTGKGVPTHGNGTNTELNQADRLAEQYGGKSGDYQKTSSSSYKASDGGHVETHAYRNVETGDIIESKTIVNPDIAGSQ